VSRRTRNPGGVICSSYDEDKKHKYRQQIIKERTTKFLVGVLALIIIAVVMSQSSMSNVASLRSGTQQNEVSPPAMDSLAKVNPVSSSRIDPNGSEKITIEKGPDNFICGRKLPFNLSVRKKWPTPFMPSLRSNALPAAGNNEVVLLKKDAPFGSLGSQLNSFFHAYDYAYDTKRSLWVTQDSWVLDTLFPLFFGPSSAVEKNNELWAAIQETLGVKIVENADALNSMGMKDVKYPSPSTLFDYVSENLESKKVRNHRGTILRKLFKYPSHYGTENVCSAIASILGAEKEKIYTVVHIVEPNQKNHLPKLDQNNKTKRDYTAAIEMSPEYVKSILKPLGMLQHDIYLIDSSDTIDNEAHEQLAKDPDLTLKKLAAEYGSKIYLAVLADVYLGNPVDQICLWIARMRFALGMKNTYIFTEKQGDQWVSYLNDDSYLDLYDSEKLGIPWMG